MSSTNKASPTGEKSVLVIGAGLAGLSAAKVLSERTSNFDSVTIFDRASSLGGVWSKEQIYNGLTTNSPLFTFEYPDWHFPEHMRRAGVHVSAEDVNTYLQSYAEIFNLVPLIRFKTEVQQVEWDTSRSVWVVKAASSTEKFVQTFSHLVICTGMYHTPEAPFSTQQTSKYRGKIFHSSEIGAKYIHRFIATRKNVLVVGGGKSALDLATLVAKGTWGAEGPSKAPRVTLLYRKPHWLSPWKIIRGTVPFEKLLFCRFVLAWQPYAVPPDFFHRLIAHTKVGRWATKLIFSVVADDFIRSLHQKDLPQTIPDSPFAEAVSGSLHVEPQGYLNAVREGGIGIVQGTLHELDGYQVHIKENSKTTISTLENVDTIILATGYRLSFPFFTPSTAEKLGLIEDSHNADMENLARMNLYRLIAPPATVNPGSSDGPYRNIAFSGFAYSFLNPAVMHVAAHWIADYFNGLIPVPSKEVVKAETNNYLEWQARTFGAHGAKGVHIGPHAPLYLDTLLKDMGVRDWAHVKGWKASPLRLLNEWFRPMLPAVYAGLSSKREARHRLVGHQSTAMEKDKNPAKISPSMDIFSLLSMAVLLLISVLYFRVDFRF